MRARRATSGTTLMVPEPGDYHVLAGRDNAQALVHGPQGAELLSNICRHRQAIMLNGKGNTPNIVCPIHRWTYDLQGKLLGAPHFADQPCEHLGRTPMQNWKGLLFDGPRDVARDLERLTLGDMDFSGYALNHVELHECRYNWKTFIEVYLEDYHVEPFHPGLGQFVTCDDLRWQFADWASVQFVGVNNGLAKAGTPHLRALAQGRARLHARTASGPRGDLADVLSEHHGRVVSARARHQHARFPKRWTAR